MQRSMRCTTGKNYHRAMTIFRELQQFGDDKYAHVIRFKGASITRYSNDGAYMKMAMKVLEEVQPKVLIFDKGDVLPLQILEQCIEEVKLRRQNEQTAV